MLTQAIENEVVEYLERHAYQRDQDGRRLVVRNGYLVWENYYAQGMPDRAATIHSVTKSVTSAVVGLARGQGYLPDLDTPLPDLLPGNPMVDGRGRRQSRTDRAGRPASRPAIPSRPSR